MLALATKFLYDPGWQRSTRELTEQIVSLLCSKCASTQRVTEWIDSQLDSANKPFAAISFLIVLGLNALYGDMTLDRKKMQLLLQYAMKANHQLRFLAKELLWDLKSLKNVDLPECIVDAIAAERNALSTEKRVQGFPFGIFSLLNPYRYTELQH